MVVGSAGFSWSGSSAITDLLKEFDDTQVYDQIEFLLAYYPDGLEDLDFHLNVNGSKFLSSSVAIPRFRKVANLLLNNATKGEVKKITDEYLDRLVQVRWKGLAQGQILLHNSWVFKHFAFNFTYKLFRRLPPNLCKKINLYPLNMIELSIEPDQFSEATLEYTDKIIQAMGLDISKTIVLDQPFAGNNPAKSLKYFRNSKAIIVDRDPRELYLLAKVYFPKTSYQIPYERVDDFILYYKNMHKTLAHSMGNSNVLYLRFEDLVYEYDKTVNKVMNFLGLENHARPRTCFVPEKSMVNTRLYIKCKDYADDIKKIEKELSEFIYDFEQYSDKFNNQDIAQQMFDDNPLSIGYKWSN
jgi:hypothetical protein